MPDLPPGLPPELAIATLKIARDLAVEVGAQVVALGDSLRASTDKGGVDVVTKADRHSEDALTAALHRHFPTHRIAAEEGTLLGPADAEWTWHVDPLDGTANYSRGLPAWAISLGLSQGERPMLGVIHAPLMGLTIYGAVGVGAWSGDTPLPRASEPGPERSWIVATDWPWDLKERERTVRLLAAMAPTIRQYKTYGSAAVDYAHVAVGRCDAYAISHTFRWDQAGGAAILAALGYELRRWDGRPWSLADRDIVASRPGMWPRFAEWLGASAG